MSADLHVESRHQVGAFEAFVDERPHHREEQRHEQRGRASLARHIAQGEQHAPIGKRNDVVEIAADRVGGSRHAEGLDAGRLEPRARQHRLLDLAGDLQVVLERKTVGHLQQHEQVHQQKPREQPERAGRKGRMGNQQEVHFAKQLHQPNQAGRRARCRRSIGARA